MVIYMVSIKTLKSLKIICCIIAFICAVVLLIDDILLVMQMNDGTLSSKFTDVPEDAQAGAGIAGLIVMSFVILPLLFFNFGYAFLFLIISILQLKSILKNENSNKDTLAYFVFAVLSAINNIITVAVLIKYTCSLAFIANLICIALNCIFAASAFIYRKKLKLFQGTDNVQDT